MKRINKKILITDSTDYIGQNLINILKTDIKKKKINDLIKDYL